MPRRFEVMLHGSGFSVPIDGGGHVRGFYALRRVIAETPESATEQVIALLRAEEKFQSLVETSEWETGNQDRCLVHVESSPLPFYYATITLPPDSPSSRD